MTLPLEPPFLWGIFGVDMNVWLDALPASPVIVVQVMTVTVMGLIYVERKFVGRLQMRLGPMRTGPLRHAAVRSPTRIKLLTKEDLQAGFDS